LSFAENTINDVFTLSTGVEIIDPYLVHVKRYRSVHVRRIILEQKFNYNVMFVIYLTG